MIAFRTGQSSNAGWLLLVAPLGGSLGGSLTCFCPSPTPTPTLSPTQSCAGSCASPCSYPHPSQSQSNPVPAQFQPRPCRTSPFAATDSGSRHQSATSQLLSSTSSASLLASASLPPTSAFPFSTPFPVALFLPPSLSHDSCDISNPAAQWPSGPATQRLSNSGPRWPDSRPSWQLYPCCRPRPHRLAAEPRPGPPRKIPNLLHSKMV